jgi:hypothetical protein
MRSKRRSETLQKLTLGGFAAALMGTAAFVPSSAMADPLPNCAGLAALLAKNPDIFVGANPNPNEASVGIDTSSTTPTSMIVPAGGGNAAYCQVNIVVSELAGPKDGYQPGHKQMISIGVGLPLSASDGGSGGVHGAWNGRIENLGGGGFAGVVGPVTDATNSGYAGSSTDTGHPASAQGFFALNPDDTLNFGLINDFAFNGIHQQAVWTKNLTQMYYGKGPQYTYWNGCSTGGRQGHEQAQRYPDDFDGILAGASAFNWDRLLPAQGWGEVVMNQEVGAPIVQAKLDAVTQAVINACDPLDGITDGIIQDPRACLTDANLFVCGEPGAVSVGANCLTPQEAGAMNKIWNGIPGRGADQVLWFGQDRGAALGDNDGPIPLVFPLQWWPYWVFQNPAFDWHTLTEKTFDQAFRDSELKFRQVIGTDNPDLSAFKRHGGKMITYHGLADGLIMSRGTYNYYNNVTKAQGGLAETQKFYRFFPYPGNGHCGITSLGGNFQTNAPLIDLSTSGGPFQALVNWVEHGVAPDTIIATNAAGGTRPICKYPDTLLYNGAGSIFSASSFKCQHQTTDELMPAENALPDPGTLGP